MTIRIMIFIPAFNCAQQISRVLSKIDQDVQQYIEEVVVIDNKSSDDTVKKAISSSYSIEKKITILRNFENYNLGGSIKRAFMYAMENDYDYMVTLHGDDQADIRDFLPIFKNGEYCNNNFIIGARFHPDSRLEGYSFVRILGNRALNFVCSILNRRRVHDLIAGINIFDVSFFRDKFFLNFPENLTFDAHLLLYAFSKNAKIKYVPITWREDDQISNAKVVRQALIIMKLFFEYFIRGSKVFVSNKSGRPDGFVYKSEVIYQK